MTPLPLHYIGFQTTKTTILSIRSHHTKMTTEEVNKQNPEEFFQSIGDKVKNLAPAAAADAQNDDDERAVEEIESLCMNCGKNVS
jgi:hypothetical protein